MTVKWGGSPVSGLTNLTCTGLSANGKSVGLRIYAGNFGSFFDSLLVTQTGSATGFSLSGPSSGTSGVASTNFTATPVGGSLASNETVTLDDGGAGGSFSTNPLSFSSGSSIGITFTYAPAATFQGTVTITATPSPTLGSPPTAQYAVTYPNATSYTLTGPTSGQVNQASTNFTVAFPAHTTGVTVTITLHDSLTGSFNPTTINLSSSITSATFTVTPTVTGTHAITTTNNASLSDPSGINYVASSTPATAITMSGPSSGYAGAPSTSFTIGANGTITGTVVVTPSDSGAGGVFTPTTVSISNSTPTQTFTYTPAVLRNTAVTISETNNGGLANASNITYTVSRPTMSPSPSALSINTSGNVIVLTGVGTTWTVNTPTFTASGLAGCSITAQNVLSNTSATVTITTGAIAGTLIVTDSVYAETCSLTVAATEVYTTSVDFGSNYTGLVGTVGYTVKKKSNNVDTVVQARSVANVTESATGSGSYSVQFTAATFSLPDMPFVVWDTGGSSPIIATDWQVYPQLVAASSQIVAGYALGQDPVSQLLVANVAFSQSTMNAVADSMRRRHQANVEASSYGDALSVNSHYGQIQQCQYSDVTTTIGKLTIKETGGSNLGTFTITTGTASPITGIGP